jgi:hypothetical protein
MSYDWQLSSSAFNIFPISTIKYLSLLSSIIEGQNKIIPLLCIGAIEFRIIFDEIRHNVVGILVFIEIMIGEFEGVGLEKGEDSCLVLESAMELIVLQLLSGEVLGSVVGGAGLHWIELLL